MSDEAWAALVRAWEMRMIARQAWLLLTPETWWWMWPDEPMPIRPPSGPPAPPIPTPPLPEPP